MEAASLWAGVRFTARNGSPEALLTDAAGQGLHLYGIFSLPGGFYGHCAAWQYRRLAALARHRRVRLWPVSSVMLTMREFGMANT